MDCTVNDFSWFHKPINYIAFNTTYTEYIVWHSVSRSVWTQHDPLTLARSCVSKFSVWLGEYWVASTNWYCSTCNVCVRENRTDTGFIQDKPTARAQTAGDRQATRQGISEHSWPSMIWARLIRSSPAFSKSNLFLGALPCYLIATRLFRNPTTRSLFPLILPWDLLWDDHTVRVVNRKGNARHQARVHWLLASLVII